MLPIDSLHIPWGWRQNFKIQLFQNMVMLHIKLKGMTKIATCKHIFCPYIHPRPLRWDQRSKHFFLKVVKLHIKITGMEQRAPCDHIFCPNTHPRMQHYASTHSVLTCTLDPWGGVKDQTFFLKVVKLHIKLI